MICDGSNSSEEEFICTPPHIRESANETYETLLPEKFRPKYESTHKKFIEWTLKNEVKIISENVVTAYMKHLSIEIKPTTLWSIYSMLKTTLNIKNNIDISKYLKLRSFLKIQSNGYKTKKSKIFTSNEIKQFLNEAPDKEFLLTKVILIFGISGGCRRQELKNLNINHVRDLGNELQVKLLDTKTKTDRTFIIPGMFYEISKRYIQLRPPDMDQFFVNYQNGKCFKQVVGVNKIGSQPKVIARYLKLPNPELFTGHCFRRSGATILADAGGDTLTVKNCGGWKSTPVMESYIENSLNTKERIGNTIVRSIQNHNQALEIEAENIPLTSKYTNYIQNNSDLEQATNNSDVTYRNCTFTNCTFIVKK